MLLASLAGGAVSLTLGVGGFGTPGNWNQLVSAGPRAVAVATGVRKTLFPSSSLATSPSTH